MTMYTHTQIHSPESSGRLLTRGMILALTLLLAAALPLSAGDPPPPIIYSPDITAVLGGVTIDDHDMAEDDGGTVTQVGPTDLPEGAEIDGLHDLGGGHFLLSFSTSVVLEGASGNILARAYDVVAYDGEFYSIYRSGAAMGFPLDANVDALTLSLFGDLVLSFDKTVQFPGMTVQKDAIVLIEGSFPVATFDASEAGMPEGLNLDARHSGDGEFMVSFDTAGVIPMEMMGMMKGGGPPYLL